MIAIFLIGLIGSIIGYNMKGSMDEGRAFKTNQAIEKLTDILELEIARGASASDLADRERIRDLVVAAGIAKNPEKLLQDGWNKDFAISVDGEGSIQITSANLDAYNKKKNDLRKHNENKE